MNKHRNQDKLWFCPVSSADIIIQNHCISQSETNVLAISDVANTYSMQRARVRDDQNVSHQYFRLLLDYRDINFGYIISQWMNHTVRSECDLIILL